MKYRTLFPPALTGLLIISVFSTMKNNTESDNKYNDYIKQARDAAAYEIYVDAEADYLEALKMNKSLEIYNELAEVYMADNKENEAQDIAKTMVNTFPYAVSYTHLYVYKRQGCTGQAAAFVRRMSRI